MKYYIHVRNEEIFFNVRALSFEAAVDKVDLILDKLGMEHDFSVQSLPDYIIEGNDFQLRVNQKGELKGAYYDSIHDRVMYDKYIDV